MEPYVYASSNILGTTVSVPVYDRSKEPHVFLGVVAVDISLAALDAALGISPDDSQGSVESIQRVALVSTARCPVLELDTCELESFRRHGATGDEALCTDICSLEDFVQVDEESCPFVDDYPTNLWANTDMAGLDFEDRTCCVIGDRTTSKECPMSKKKD